MTTTESKYAPEVAERLGKQLFEEFWENCPNNQNDKRIATLLFDLAHLFPDATLEVQYMFETEVQKVISRADNKLLVLIQGYSTTSRVAYYSRLCILFQNMITETATTLQDWQMVFTNEHPSPNMCKTYMKDNHIMNGILKNVALQQILLLSETWQDVDFVIRNANPGSQLHSSAILKKTTLRGK